MKKDIILCGVGGQGILSIATIIGEASTEAGLYLKQAEVHGMSQRGGDVQSNLRLSTDPIWSDLIPLGETNVIISMEPMEALRYLPYLSKQGTIVTSSKPFVNIPNYPDEAALMAELDSMPSVVKLDIESVATDAGNARGANMVVLGCLAKVCPGMISGVKPFEFALDEAISARNKKFNPINIATIEAAYNKDYDIK